MKNKKMTYLLFMSYILTFSCANKMLLDHTNSENSNSTLNKPYVLLISIDGYRYDYTKLYKPKNILNFIKNGSFTEKLIPIYPSKTFPNHYAIATGMYAENHGIISNHFYSKKRKQLYTLKNRDMVKDGSWYKGTPLWVLAEKQQMLTASFFFVGSDADIQGIHPHYYYNYNKAIPHSVRIKQILDWTNLPEKIRPHFITLYFSDVDSAGHHYGPKSDETKKAVTKVDKTLGILFKKLKKRNLNNLNIIIVSDHGMQRIENIKKFSYISNYINLDDVIVTGGGSHLNIYVKNKKNITMIYKSLKNIPQSNVYLKEKMPPELHYSHSEVIGDIIISATSNHYILKKKSKISSIKNYLRKGTHGYDPNTSKNMAGIFYAKGPQIKKSGLFKSFKNIHIYPFICKILDLKINHKIDGRSKVLNFLLK